MNDATMITALSILRILPMLLVFWTGWRYDNKLAMLIAVLWVLAVVAGLQHWKWSSTVFGTPLVMLISWYILKHTRNS